MTYAGRAVLVCFILTLLFQMGCAGTTAGSTTAASATTGSNPNGVQVASVSPSTVAAGAAAFTLVVNGTMFSQNSQILWNGASHATSFVNSSQLTAQISSQSVAEASVVSVAVQNGPAEVSNTVNLTVSTPLAISTAELPAGSIGSA